MKEAIFTNKSPKPIGPYSQAIRIENTLYISGQIGLNPEKNILVNKTIEKETRQVMENLKNILYKAGYDFQDVVKTNIFLTNLTDFNKVNEVYASYFKNIHPARETVQVSSLPLNANVEISMIAAK